jgi:hypothetical protein
LALITLTGCGRSHRDGPTGAESTTGGSAPTAGGGAGGGGTAGESSESGGAAGEPPSVVTRPTGMRRLTAAEYAATTSDVLGTTLEPQLAEFTRVVDGFDNNAEANGVDQALYLRYLETAEALADEVFATDAVRQAYVVCQTADDTTCVNQVVNRFGLRLFRRPLLTEEVGIYAKVYARARQRSLTHEASLRDVLVALLASAQFVYRVEFASSQAGTQPVAPYDMASRLSYLFWSSAPDDALLDAASNNELSTDEQLRSSVQRLLDDTRSSRLGDNFAGQWLGAREVRALELDKALFPEWSPGAAAGAAGELSAFFTEITRKEQDFTAFFDSRVHFVNEDLAALYGIPSVFGPGLQPRELADGTRTGVLGLIGVLAQTSQPTRSAPTARGAWLLRNLLCQAVPDPPADHPTFEGHEDSVADSLQALQSQPECAACHDSPDSLGLRLEAYDALGRYRTSYPSGKPIDDGAPELSQSLREAAPVRDCVALKLYTYAFGRSVGDADRPNVAALSAQWQRGPHTVHQLLLRLVQSPPFRTLEGSQP